MVLVKPEPRYTEEARGHSTRGSISLRCVFSGTGKVTNVEVLAGLPYGLSESAVDVARKTYFIPAVKDGHFVSTPVQLEYNFNLY
jgi:protein TonB